MAAAIAGTSYVTDAQAQQPHKPVVQHAAPTQRNAPQLSTQRPTSQVHIKQQNSNTNLHATGRTVQRATPGAQLNPPGGQHANPKPPKFNPNLTQQKGPQSLQGGGNTLKPGQGKPTVNPVLLKPGPGKPVVNPVLLKPGPGGLKPVKPGPGGPTLIKPAFPVVNVNNKFFPILKGPKFIWIGGYRRFFVPVGVLGVVLIGGSYWDPDGYVSIPAPACAGFTPDGCRLHWRMVDFEDGGAAPQCVQYCPRVGSPPPQVATLPPPAPVPENGACQVTIFSDQNFAGNSAPTGDAQPDLSQSGWRNEIASIQVQAGTWDFFSDENYGGESLRLPAGPYPILAPEWSKRIGSFMCVEPGAPGA